MHVTIQNIKTVMIQNIKTVEIYETKIIWAVKRMYCKIYVC